MNIWKYSAALFTAALLTACGGGAQPEAQQQLTPQQAVQKLQAKAAQLRRSTIPLDDQAAQLMDYAESALPGFFPGHPDTNTLPPFKFRFYGDTNVYLGVSIDSGTPFTQGNVFVMGGVFGSNPLDVGPLTNYVTPTGGGGGGGSGNGCFDLALADTQGTTLHLKWNYSGTITGTVTEDSTIGAMTTYESHSARAIAVNTTGTAAAQSLSANGTAYQLRTGDAELTQYGGVFVGSVSGFTANIKTVNNPPTVDISSGLEIGHSFSLTHKGTVTTTLSGTPIPLPPTVTAVDTSTTITYVGDESVTVPAGQFQACKYTAQVQGSDVVTTTWYVKGKGLPVKITGDGQVIEATEVKINGSSL